MEQKILLDTNFLLIPFQHKVDIFAELDRILNHGYSLFILDRCVDELEKLKAGKGKEAQYAKMALSLMEKKDIKIIKTQEKKHTDRLIEDQEGYIIATRDMDLIRSLRKKPFKVITLRQKSHLVLIEP